MVNQFQSQSFDSTLGTMGATMSRFFGGGQKLNDLYSQVFQPLYASPNSFAQAPNSFSHSGPATDAFSASYARPPQTGYSRFQPNLNPAGEQFALAAMGGGTTGTGTTGTAGSGAGGTGSATTSSYAALDAHNAEINAVAAKVGVPANLLKSMINRESSGNWERDGNYSIDPDGNGELIPFVGVRRATAASVGIDYDQMLGNKALQIEAMARVLARDHSAYGSWEAAASNYLTGDPQAYLTGGTDSQGRRADTYVADAMSLWHELDGSSGVSQDPASPGYGQASSTGASSTGQMATISGSTPASISFDFGAEGGPNLYGYGTAYGLNGSQHTGIDIGMPLNSNIYAPMGGTVTCGGTGNGPGAGGGGCSAFNDYMGGGNGRIEIQLDNGSVLIFGHTSATNVQPGQRVSAGTLLGRSGGMNGPHVHLEARVRDGNTSSGWRIVDPRTILSGSVGGGGVAGATGTAPSVQTNLFSSAYAPQRNPWSSWLSVLT